MNRPEAIEPVVAELAREQLEECRRFFELGDTSRVVLAANGA